MDQHVIKMLSMPVIFVYDTCLHMALHNLVMRRSIVTHYYYHRLMCTKMIVHLFYVVIITIELVCGVYKGVDNVPERFPIDYQTNQYCDIFIYLLFQTVML